RTRGGRVHPAQKCAVSRRAVTAGRSVGEHGVHVAGEADPTGPTNPGPDAGVNSNRGGTMRIVHTRRWSRGCAVAGAAVVPVLAAACSGGDPAPPPNAPVPQAPSAPSSSGQDERAAVEATYTQYWPRSAQTPHQPEDTWHDAMA